MSVELKVEKFGQVLEITINRGKANAIDVGVSREMGLVFQKFRDDPDLRVAILTGAGERFFCAGWDLKAANEGEQADVDYGVGGFGGIQELPNLNKPIIGAINGIACGGGLEIALATDIIIASDTARFSLPEIQVGVIADAGTIKLPRRLPYHVAVEFLMTGRWMDVDEAHRWGLVNEIVPPLELMNRAREVASKIAAGPPLIYRAIKDVLRRCEMMRQQEALEFLRALDSVQKVYRSEDLKEGTRAFTEKRSPVWRGR